MPIYEYECPTHGRYEVSQRITEDALTTCREPGCGQTLSKLISHTSFALKGGGWYADGYGSGGTSGGGSDAKVAAPAASTPATTPAATPAPAAKSEPAPGAPAPKAVA